MPRTSPWHPVKATIHHDTNRNTGSNIERDDRRDGAGDRPPRKECKDLTDAGK